MINDLTSSVIGSAIKVHKVLGPGLLESSYKECLSYELNKKGLFVEKEKPVPLIYEEVKLECGYRLDLLIENELVLELKAVDGISEIHIAQTLTYMKLMNKKFGLLINFNVVLLKDGIKRLINKYYKE
ncbi:MAG: GxxExxY protein [Ignavibacteria bacterium]|nr:GxxExxY protein [Ignavibacteria bacterium]